MTSLRILRALVPLAAVAALAIAAPTLAAGPPPPKSANGKPVVLVGSGIPTPTSFAFNGANVFVGAAGSEDGKAKGGLYVIANGKAKKVQGAPPFILGLAFHNNALYVSAGKQILTYRGFNGRSFASHSTLFTGGKDIPGFNGIAIGPDSRLYAGISLADGKQYDAHAGPGKYANSVVSMDLAGKDLQVEAKGLRQPYGITFVPGDPAPFVTDLSQDSTKVVPPDHIDRITRGDDYGFPTCTHATETPCASFAKPLVTLPKHASPTGLTSSGASLYVALFGGLKGKPAVASVSAMGQVAEVLTGFAAPASAVGANKGSLYVGDLTGAVYKVAVG